jgi:hypothetical protein
MSEWPNKLTRSQAIKLVNDITFKDDPYWENLVVDYYDETTDTMPTIYHIFMALGVTESEYKEATNEPTAFWPSDV